MGGESQTRSLVTRRQAGMTLVELICSIMIMLVLTMAVLPLARIRIKRERERELHAALDEMRAAIDRYKDASDRGLIQVKLGSEGYPPDLDSLVKGVDMVGQVDKKFKFLRRIPMDPMTRSTEWGMRSMQDDPKSTTFGGQNVFDVFTKSQDKALDGTSYNDW
jgi:general secretion pathway protein G